MKSNYDRKHVRPFLPTFVPNSSSKSDLNYKLKKHGISIIIIMIIGTRNTVWFDL